MKLIRTQHINSRQIRARHMVSGASALLEMQNLLSAVGRPEDAHQHAAILLARQEGWWQSYSIITSERQVAGFYAHCLLNHVEDQPEAPKSRFRCPNCGGSQFGTATLPLGHGNSGYLCHSFVGNVARGHRCGWYGRADECGMWMPEPPATKAPTDTKAEAPLPSWTPPTTPDMAAGAVFAQLTGEDIKFAGASERGINRGFAALHDRMDANMLLPGHENMSLPLPERELYLAWLNRITDIVTGMIIAHSNVVRSVSKILS